MQAPITTSTTEILYRVQTRLIDGSMLVLYQGEDYTFAADLVFVCGIAKLEAAFDRRVLCGVWEHVETQ